MKNLKTKGIFTLFFALTMFLTMSLGIVFAKTEYVPVYVTITDADGKTLKPGPVYTDIDIGDKIYVKAYCEDEKALYWASNSYYMNQTGFKANDKGMGLLGYVYDDMPDDEIVDSYDPTQVVITIPNFKRGTTHRLSIEGVGAVDGLVEEGITYMAKSGWIDIDFKIPEEQEEVKETTITETITRINSSTLRIAATVENGTFSKIVYYWDNETSQQTTSNPVDVTIPNFAAGTTHKLTATAYTTNGKTATKTYTVTIPDVVDPGEPEEPENLTGSVSAGGLIQNETVELPVRTGITISGKPAENFLKVTYAWDNDEPTDILGASGRITVPNFAENTRHKLTVTGTLKDGTEVAKKVYYISIPVDEPADNDDNNNNNDELIIEPWMREDKEAEGLLVSLRNDTDIEKANKNFYQLDEEVIYYVDYKNCGKDIDEKVKLVLTLPLKFSVVDSDSGKVSTSNKTITWTFNNGLEEDESGTKEVIVKYTKLTKTSYEYEMVYPQASIYRNDKVKDTSAVINCIYESDTTEIDAEHRPYMYGDEEKPTFRPDDTITRAEGALVLTRIFGLKTSSTKITTKFSDIDETYYEAQKAITVASEYGIINGYEDGKYRPNDKMTRAEFMKIIASYIEYLGEEESIKGLEVKDGKTIKVYKNALNRNHWAIPYVTLLTRLNMTPASNGERDLRLEDEITRAEVAQLVNFYLFRAPAKVTASTKIPFIDVSKKHDLFADIIEATRDVHTFVITEDGKERAK